MDPSELLRTVLQRLPFYSECSVAQAEDAMCEELGFDALRLEDGRSLPFNPATKVADLLREGEIKSLTFSVRQESHDSRSSEAVDPVRHSINPKPPGGGRNAAPLPSKAETSGEARATSSASGRERIIRELHSLETRRGPSWAGFLVNELLPGMGFSPLESKQLLSDLEAGGVVQTIRKTNPRNPDRPATYVQLNYDNAEVKAAIARVESTRKRISVRGEPVSTTLLRDRR